VSFFNGKYINNQVSALDEQRPIKKKLVNYIVFERLIWIERMCKTVILCLRNSQSRVSHNCDII
jgi:hypothetical protein